MTITFHKAFKIFLIFHCSSLCLTYLKHQPISKISINFLRLAALDNQKIDDFIAKFKINSNCSEGPRHSKASENFYDNAHFALIYLFNDTVTLVISYEHCQCNYKFPL